jgi:hypothetical protein
MGRNDPSRSFRHPATWSFPVLCRNWVRWQHDRSFACKQSHIAFAIEGKDRTITELRKQSDLRTENVVFVEGETKDTLPGYHLEGEVDLVLLDGPHAYPLPQIEFAYLFPGIRLGGWLVVDDIQIPSVYELFHFLEKESSVALEEVVVRTAFFRRISAAEHGPDGWALQGMNRHKILRYSWRDRLARLLGKS